MRTFCYSYPLVKHIQNTHDVASVEKDDDIPLVDDEGGDDDPLLHIDPAVHDDNPVVPEAQPLEHELNEHDVRKSAAIFVANMKASRKEDIERENLLQNFDQFQNPFAQ